MCRELWSVLGKQMRANGDAALKTMMRRGKITTKPADRKVTNSENRSVELKKKGFKDP